MTSELVAKQEITVGAPIEKVWEALVTPELIKKYMFGADAVSDWQVGSSLVWRGEWEGKRFEDKGKILKMEENRVLQYSYFSAFSGKEDKPENYHTITISLSAKGDKTNLELIQDGISSQDEKEHSEKNWRAALGELKNVVED